MTVNTGVVNDQAPNAWRICGVEIVSKIKEGCIVYDL